MLTIKYDKDTGQLQKAISDAVYGGSDNAHTHPHASSTSLTGKSMEGFKIKMMKLKSLLFCSLLFSSLLS